MASGGVLSREELRTRIEGEPPLIAEWLDLDEQLQPNGFDLSLRTISRLEGAGTLARTNTGRVLPTYQEIAFGVDDFVRLDPGVYQVVFNEIVDLPPDLMALGRPRSTLCRCGVGLVTAVWDAGYRGRSTAMLHVVNPAGFAVERDARLLQLVFFTLKAATERGYAGVYFGEHTAP
ncbi:MAG: deoxyuridine 5'-triphosphate nucleotidohydrolase [Chloroflexia bacterium]|nr:deoxyuridine 5'-triphosphate nucleotidohydrolase [Chloroflexia bacterium]